MKTKNILFVIALFFSFLLNIISEPILTAQSLNNNFDPNAIDGLMIELIDK